VETAAVEQRSVADRFTAVGSIEAAEFITVVAEIDGLVDAMPFREGDAVAAGSLLARIDDEQLRAEVARSEAVLQQARSTHARVESLVAQQLATAQQHDDTASAVRVAEANVEVARVRLDKARIVAPWSGVVGSRRVSPGAFLHAGDGITDLSKVDEVKILFSAPERYLPDLHVGADVTITTTAWPDRPVAGRITLVDLVLDAATRNARVTARAANPDGRLRPGMSADVAVLLAERAGALVVPSEAVFFEGNQALVYVVGDDGKVARTAISLGTRLPEVVEVTSGLSAGQRVVRAGHQKLYPGAAVQAVSSRAAGAEGGAAGSGAVAP
jgi:membrane fusion protein (multidrug efflux system)